MLSSFLGEHFHLRTALSEEECRRRIEQVRPPWLLTGNFDDAPVGVWKWHKVYLWRPERQGAQLIATMRASGRGTEIVGRAGMDDIMLAAAIVVTGSVVGASLIIPDLQPHERFQVLFIALISVGFYLLKRRSPHGGELIDFLQELLDAENLNDRRGDSISRS